ncbi:MAG: hypothetical protein K6E69_07315 [Treponema sp.]|uniref:hypothetical protein n=1 Tax=Treponema sp. TaxID=166 RepID=UPI00298D81D1|nr:hypothetical protein [Treponema sp.]MCR5386914.1 hypothetical protein [Treponema sp.]
MNGESIKVIEQISDFISDKASKGQYGDITVTVTLKEGHPVKLTTPFVTHFYSVRQETLWRNKSGNRL